MPKRLMKEIKPHLLYEGNFRAGTIHYHDGDLQLQFYHEMGGGDCFFYILIPSSDQWEAQTQTPIERREEIIHFLAKRVKMEKASGKRYEIQDSSIVFYN
jgi:hypothetical protein